MSFVLSDLLIVLSRRNDDCIRYSKARRADESDVIKSINQSVSTEIAKFAVPSAIYCVKNLPKSRPGKVMRRLLRKLTTGEENLGDTSTLLDVSVLDHIKNAINNK